MDNQMAQFQGMMMQNPQMGYQMNQALMNMQNPPNM